jgi:hypothetical protein
MRASLTFPEATSMNLAGEGALLNYFCAGEPLWRFYTAWLFFPRLQMIHRASVPGQSYTRMRPSTFMSQTTNAGKCPTGSVSFPYYAFKEQLHVQFLVSKTSNCRRQSLTWNETFLCSRLMRNATNFPYYFIRAISASLDSCMSDVSICSPLESSADVCTSNPIKNYQSPMNDIRWKVFCDKILDHYHIKIVFIYSAIFINVI